MSEIVFHKVCAFCKKAFQHTARKTKFCSPDCGKKYQKLRKRRKKEYDLNRNTHLVAVRARSLAVLVMDVEVEEGRRIRQCEMCGSESNLHVHHKDVVYLNNVPDNLQFLCNDCHVKVHEKDKSEENVSSQVSQVSETGS